MSAQATPAEAAGTMTAARLAAMMGQAPLIMPVNIGNLACELATDGSPATVSHGALVVVGASDGRFVFEVPRSFINTVLADAPEPVLLNDLSESDAGLLIEHVASGLLGKVEDALGEKLSVLGVLQGESIGPEFEPIGFTLTHKEEPFDCAFFVSSDGLRGKIGALIADHNRTGRAIQKGEIVAMGPVVLTREEANAVTVGDVIVMEGARFGRLTGAFLFTDGSVRAADLADGFATLKAPDHSIGQGGIPIYFEVGSAAQAASGQTGTRIQFLPFEGHKIFVCVGRRRVGTGELVDAGGSLAISVKTLGDS